MSFGGGTLFLSFIVPVYNVEKYLEECLDSLLEQDIPYEEYEIICVNDGSTDGSLEILRRYEEKFSNIRVIDQENGGLSAARNAGLEYSCGAYVCYVDSDDFVQRNSLAEVKAITNQTKCDRLYMGAYEFDVQLTEQEKQAVNTGSLCPNSKQFNITVWSNFFRMETLRKHSLYFHPELRYAEDGVYMLEWNFVEKEVCRSNSTFYFYRHRAQSLMTEKSAKSQANRIDGCTKLVQYFNKYYQEKPEMRKLIADKLMSNLWYLIYMVLQLPAQQRKVEMRRLKQENVFPYVRPMECTLEKSYQTTRTDLVGRIFDKIYINLHTRTGFYCMRLWKVVEKVKHKLEGRP